MTVSFDCARCGKHFEVPEQFAGKRGVCKQCGNVNRIPQPSRAEETAGAELEQYDLHNAPSQRRKPFAPAAAADDPYGLDDEPVLPRRTRPPADDDPLPAPPRARKKKKRVGLFARQSTS